ncbi:bifunctional diguanylate cyclase/phosphodiesterase [Gudongella sp. DL1XJH-153]|uniref:bifunctional diguanylate cyclase/phosphodiesterase n=1 Tax=Gudongella sp. DL1XJH-153 TaxID=3409804 RepID=UPI003BB5E13E
MNFRDDTSNDDNGSKKLKSKLDYYNKLQAGIRPQYESARLILIYVVIGSLWIVFSDIILVYLAGDIALYQRMQTFKGWFYVIFSGMIFYFIVKNRMELFKDASEQLYKGYVQLDLSHNELRSAKDELQEKYDQLNYYQNELEESRLKYNLSIQGANDGVWNWDIKNDIYNTSTMTKENFGYTKEEQESIDTISKWQSLVHPEDLAKGRKKLYEYVDTGEDIYENIFRIKTASGEYRWILSRGKLIRQENGEPMKLAGSHTDLTEQMILQENLHQEKELVESISREAPIGILVCDKMGIVTKINNYGEKLLGYEEIEILGKNAYQIFIDEQEKSELNRHLEQVFLGHSMRNIETRIATKYGEVKTILWSNSFLHDMDDEITGLVFVGVDISDRKELEEKLERLAYFDPLTEMSNKEKFREDTIDLISNNQKIENPFAMVYLDIDNFKLVNDTMGHAAGDELIRHIGYSMISVVGTKERVYRFGGDEFVILLDNTSETMLGLKINNIMEKIRVPWHYNEHTFHISVSAGVAVYPHHGEDYEQLMQNADTALSYAKDKGKNIFVVYDREMREQAWNHIQLSNDLRTALERDEFKLHYQPQVNLSTGEIVGVEALIRWNHPVKGNIPPADFIPFSEETGQIDKIEEWVIDTACRQSKIWYQDGYKNISISINISGKMLGRSEWIDRIQEYILDCKSYGRIVFEITETAIISDLEISLVSLKQIHDLGIKLALDDFGTGFSSLTYLQKLPIDIIKLDKDFIWEIGVNEGKEFIIKAVIDLAHNLGMNVVAEGVETDEQLHFLKAAGCDYAQGYLFNKPMNATDVEKTFQKL